MDTAPTQTSPSAPAPTAAPTLDQVLAGGEEMRVRVRQETAEERQCHQRMTGGLRVVPLYDALRESVSASRARQLAEEYRARPAGEEAEDEGVGEIAVDVLCAYDALRALHRAYHSAALRALHESREMWTGEESSGLRFERGSSRTARYYLDLAASYAPTAWAERSNYAGELKATLGQRGLYRSWTYPGYPDGKPLQPLRRSRIRISCANLQGNAVHELCHRAQDVVPYLADLERDLYVRCTTLPDGTREPALTVPGYHRSERFRDGGFFSRYAGRDPALDPEAGPAYEILPTGLEALLGGDPGYFESFYLHHDYEHEAFVLGALASL